MLKPMAMPMKKPAPPPPPRGEDLPAVGDPDAPPQMEGGDAQQFKTQNHFRTSDQTCGNCKFHDDTDMCTLGKFPSEEDAGCDRHEPDDTKTNMPDDMDEEGEGGEGAYDRP